MKEFDNKVLLITGGTGSFGGTVLEKFINSNIKEIRIFSRDEKKQEDLRLYYKNTNLIFIVGDVRDYKSIRNAMCGVDFVFQAAALKQVPTCEFFPMQAINTNILGSENVLEAAIDEGVSHCVVLSTDKAVYPINTMGMTKALMEKLAVSKSREAIIRKKQTKIMITRYGNVMCSRGSVIPLFINQIKNGADITVTDPTMTRFLMSLDDSVKLVIKAFTNGISGDTFVQKAPACTILTLAEALLEMFNAKNRIKIIGSRHSEKNYETLCSKEEMLVCEELDGYYRVPADLRDINYGDYFSHAMPSDHHVDEYNSDNTQQLTRNDVINLLLEQPYVRSQLNYGG